MAGRALLIGAALDGLVGVENDLAMMREVLAQRGFSTRTVTAADATRAGILEAYETFIAQVEQGDAAVVYFSGHGGLVAPPEQGAAADATGAPELMDMQFIVPIDFRQSSEGDFRGVTSVELSILQERLAQRTRNVVVILDCCHSAWMSRDPRAPRVKGMRDMPSYRQVRAHISKLRDEGLRLDLWRSDGSPDAVRLVACAPRRAAYEYTGDDGKAIGVLTESLAMALREAGTEKVTWATVMDRVRQRVSDLYFAQRPEAEGPFNRLLFETGEEDLLDSLPVTRVDDSGRVRLPCAPLLAVQVGDEFAVMPPGAAGVDEATAIGELTVEVVKPLWAEGRVRFGPSQQAGSLVPVGARAFRTRAAAPGIAVRIPVGDPRADGLISALPLAALVRAVAPDDPDAPEWFIEVRIEGERDGGRGREVRLTICDRIGPLHDPIPADGNGIDQIIRDLKVLAQTVVLRRLAGSTAWALEADVGIVWGTVADGEARPLAAEGEQVCAGELVYFSVSNNGRSPVFVSLVDIGASGRITVLTRSTPSGRELRGGAVWTYGFDEQSRELRGKRTSWPTGLDPAHARPETVLVFVTSAPQDLSALEQRGLARTRGWYREFGSSPLQDLIDQLETGGTREVHRIRGVGRGAGDGVRYDVYALTFDLVPPAGM